MQQIEQIEQKNTILKIDISECVKECVEILIYDKAVECNSDLLEKAIIQWIDEYIDDLSIDIEWHFHNNSRLQKLINEAELQSEKLTSKPQLISRIASLLN